MVFQLKKTGYNIYYGIYGGSYVKNGTTAPEIPASNMLNNCEPYQVSEVSVYRYSDGKSYTMGGDTFTDCLHFYLWNPSRTAKAYFNFGGNYESITFLYGHIDGSPRYDTTLKIELDGEEYMILDQPTDSLPTEVTVPLEGVYQMILTVSSSQAYNTYDYEYGIGAIQLVSNGVARGVILNHDTLSLSADNPAAYLKATVVPPDADDPTVTWSSADPLIADVNERGLVTGISGGTTVITATTAEGGFTASCQVTVDLPVRGDVNKNGKVDNLDAAMILQAFLDLADIDAVLADVDGNGTIDCYDAALILINNRK